MVSPANPVRTPASCKVAICMTTFRRPEGAMSALSGIAGQVFPRTGSVDPLVIVVDNDAAAPMRERVEGLQPGYPFPLVYACETRQGVASARNRCLDLVPADADYMAFIDDDEIPVPQWLDELVWTARRKNAEIVQGPVLSRFDEGAPDWVRAGRFLDLGPFPEGETLAWGYSGNVLHLGAAIAPPEPALRRAVRPFGRRGPALFHQGTPRWLRHPHGSGCDRA